MHKPGEIQSCYYYKINFVPALKLHGLKVLLTWKLVITAEEYDDDMTRSWNTGQHFAAACIKTSACPSHKVNTSTIFEDFSAVSQDFLRKKFPQVFHAKGFCT